MEAIYIIFILIIIVQAIITVFLSIIKFLLNAFAYFELLRINKRIQVLEKSNIINLDKESSKVISYEEQKLKVFFSKINNDFIEIKVRNKLRDIFIIKENLK